MNLSRTLLNYTPSPTLPLSLSASIVLLGRTLMEYVGLNTPPDIYTAAIGMYVVWVTVRVATAIISKTREGFGVITKQFLLWTYQV